MFDGAPLKHELASQMIRIVHTCHPLQNIDHRLVRLGESIDFLIVSIGEELELALFGLQILAIRCIPI